MLIRVLGRSGARALCALRLAFKERAHVIMGYHWMPNGLMALLIARASGARSCCQLTGGPVQLIGGGFGSENALLRQLSVPSRLLERLALAIARRFDLLVVRGSKAKEYLEARRVAKRTLIVPGSIETARFADRGEPREIDVVWVGRLVEVKQPAQMLGILAHMAPELEKDGLWSGSISTFKAVIVGDGPLRESLERRAAEWGLGDRVRFLGHQDRVEEVLRRSKVFLLTSRSEGLSIALAEAMAAGAVPVVADVGDLGDLVRHRVNGYLVPPDDISEYAIRIGELLASPSPWESFSDAARRAAVEYNDIGRIADRWARTFDDLCSFAGWIFRPFAVPDRRPICSSKSLSRLQRWEALSPKAKARLQRPIGWVPPRWFLGPRYRATEWLLAKADRWPTEVQETYALAQVRRICRLAYEKTPFYRHVFQRVGFDPNELRTHEDLQGLPTIDKSTLREHLEEMGSVPPNWAGVDRVSTGGTSGSPLTFYIGVERSGIEYAHLVDAWRRAGYRLEIPQAVLRGRVVPADDTGLRHEYDPILRRHAYSTFHMTDENMACYLRHIAGLGPCFLHVYPSSVDLLARFLERTGQPAPPNILGILAGSEMVYPAGRARAQRVFGVRYFSWYGHSEKLVFAAECEHSSDYHVYPTYGYFELLDEDGRRVTTPGQRGEIVGTGYINTVVPFIRYRTGDYATYVGGICEACARAQTLIRDIRGHRTQEMLVGKDGALISWTALNMHDDTFDRVVRFQFVQDTPGQATLRVIPAPGFGPDDEARILRNLNRKLSGNLEVTVKQCPDIPLTRTGKTTFVDQRLPLVLEGVGE
jgi:phenylacetate-CoA ligase